MLHLRGCSALSDFRLQKLRKQIARHRRSDAIVAVHWQWRSSCNRSNRLDQRIA